MFKLLPINSSAQLTQLLWWLCISVNVCMTCRAWGQTPTVAELIDRLKQQKQQEIMGLSVPPPKSPVAASPGKKAIVNKTPTNKTPGLPILWSISGINNNLEVILIYQGKAHVLTSDLLPARVGPWVVESISDQGVELRSLHRPQDPVIELNAPSLGSSIDPYAVQLGVDRAFGHAQDGVGVTVPQLRVNSASSSAFSAQWTNNESASVLFGTMPSYPQPGPLPQGPLTAPITVDQPEGAMPKKP